MESDTSMIADSSSSGMTFTDPISSFFGGIFFIIILVLILIFIVILLFANGVSWVANKATGGTTKQGFDNRGPSPLCESDERCATFPQI
jgi:uncharacterized membrane protein